MRRGKHPASLSNTNHVLSGTSEGVRHRGPVNHGLNLCRIVCGIFADLYVVQFRILDDRTAVSVQKVYARRALNGMGVDGRKNRNGCGKNNNIFPYRVFLQSSLSFDDVNILVWVLKTWSTLPVAPHVSSSLILIDFSCSMHAVPGMSSVFLHFLFPFDKLCVPVCLPATDKN